jgi:hypothetical protein
MREGGEERGPETVYTAIADNRIADRCASLPLIAVKKICVVGKKLLTTTNFYVMLFNNGWQVTATKLQKIGGTELWPKST